MTSLKLVVGVLLCYVHQQQQQKDNIHAVQTNITFTSELISTSTSEGQATNLSYHTHTHYNKHRQAVQEHNTCISHANTLSQ